MNVLISGASGLIGTALSRHLADGGDTVYRLVRREVSSEKEFRWVPSQGELPGEAIDAADVIINLAGENIASGLWSEERKSRILASRVDATSSIVSAIKRSKNRPKILISASAVGYYGDRANLQLAEDASKGELFLSDVCEQWEAEALKAQEYGVRVVCPRISMVVARGGGALQKMLLPFSLGLGGRLGSGEQYVSWISIDDFCKAIQFCISESSIDGPVNCCAPKSVTNTTFTKTLGRVLGRPTILPVPEFVLKLVLGQFAQELLLSSSNCIPDKLLSAGFEFSEGDLETALRQVLNKKSL